MLERHTSTLCKARFSFPEQTGLLHSHMPIRSMQLPPLKTGSAPPRRRPAYICRVPA